MTDLVLKNLVYETRKNVIEMLKYRGFNTDNVSNLSIEETDALLNNHKAGGFDVSSNLSALDIILNDENIGKKIIIKYRLDEKFSPTKKMDTQILELYDKYELTKKDCLILLNIEFIMFKDDKNNKLLKFINNHYLHGRFVQIYGLQNFKFNISQHIYVPKHQIISSKDKVKNILDFYHTSLEKLPKIKREDPMAKYIGAHPGDLIHIKGYNESTAFIDKYRYCIDTF